MTDSGARPGKRERLVSSASDLLYRQGVERTTIAQIANAADVPPGNVYYYFKTRDDLVHAAIDAQAGEMTTLFAGLERLPDPHARLRGLIHSWTDDCERAAEYGCPMGGLCSELNKVEGDLSRHAAGLIGRLIDWAAGQFVLMGRPDGPQLAVTMIARIEGAMLLANTLRDPQIMFAQSRELEEWVDSLA
jgi:AcrR family transcriptional regulator